MNRTTLELARDSLLAIRSIESQLRVAQELQQAPRQSQLGEVHAKTENRLEKLTENVIEYEDSLTVSIELYIDCCRKCEEYLCTLPAAEATVLRQRYLLARTWDEVADATNYSARHCKRLAKNALSKMS